MPPPRTPAPRPPLRPPGGPGVQPIPVPPIPGGGWGLGSMIRWILLGGLGAVGAVLGALIIAIILMITGSPKPCVERTNAYSAAASQDLRARWKTFEAQAAAGNAQIAMTEGAVTSRGIEYIDEKDLPVEDLQVYFCPDGHAEAAGRIKIAGVDSDVVAEGTLDLSGDRPRIRVDRVRVGNLPSAVGTRAVNFILDRGDARTPDLKPRITAVGYGDGTATLSGAPR